MVAVVTGSTAGLNTSSLALLGSSGGVGNASSGGRGGERIYVNGATGNLVIQRQDDYLATLGDDLPLLNTYNSLGQMAGGFDNADAWQFSGSKRIKDFTGTVNVSGGFKRVDSDGSEQTFTWDGARSAYMSKDGDGAFDSFVRQGSGPYTWTFTDGDTGVTETYSDFGTNNGQIISRTTVDNRTVTYSYTGTYLTEIRAATSHGSGETDAILINYVSGTGKISDVQYVRKTSGGAVISGSGVTRVRYGYDASNRLQSITTDKTPDDNSVSNGIKYDTTFTYNTNGLVDKITQSDGSETSFTYELDNGQYWLKTVVEKTGAATTRTTTLTYDRAARRTTIADPLGNATVLTFKATSNYLEKIEGPTATGLQTFIFDYDADGNVTSITDAKGQTTVMTYDTRGNRLTQRDAAGNTVIRTYHTVGSKNLLLTEAFYTGPDPDAGGPNPPTGALVTRNVYDSDYKYLRYVVSAEGRVTEYRWDAFGNRTAVIEYWGNTYNVTALADNASIPLTDLDNWRNGTADRTKSRRTDYAYDSRGELTSSTTWASVNSSGDGVAGNQTLTSYTYNYVRQLLSTTDSRGTLTSYVYDGLGRQLSKTVTPPAGQGAPTLTTMVYDDGNRKVETVFANGLKTTAVSDHAGQLVSLQSIDNNTSAALGTTQYYYDLAGREILVKDQLGIASRKFYDQSDRLVGEVDRDGALTEYFYDKNNQVFRTLTYATRVTAALVDAGGNPTALTLASTGVRPTANLAADRYTYRVFDLANRLAVEVKSLGTGGSQNAAITHYGYDGASRLTQTTRKATISTYEFQAAPEYTLAVFLASYDVPADATNDRRTRNFYDKDGQLIGVLDADGYLTENKYDSGGQLTQTVRYFTLTNSSFWATGTLAQLLPATNAQDITTSYVYDGKGRQVGIIDGQNLLTETQYDVVGNVTAKIRYNTATTYVAGGTISQNRPATGANQTTSFVYDGYNRVTQETNHEGTITTFVYNNVGNLTSRTVASGQTPRETQRRYDVLGRVTAELTAQGSAALTGGMNQAQIDAVWNQYGIKHFYDQAGNRIRTEDQNGRRTWFFYDREGRLRYELRDSTYEWWQWVDVVDYRYNAFGEVGQRQQYSQLWLGADSVATHTTASLDSYFAGVIDTHSDLRTYGYSRAGLLAAETDAAGKSVTSTYNAFGEQATRSLTLSPTDSQVEEWSYNRRGLLTQYKVDPTGLNAVEQRTYDAFGRLKTVKDPKQVAALGSAVTTYVYDKIGRVIQTNDVLGRGSYTTYDAYSRTLTTADVRGNVTQYNYNDTTRTMTVTTPEGVAIVNQRNRHGQTISVTEPGGRVVSTTYNGNGQVIQRSDNLNGGSTLFQATYDAAGLMLTSTAANGAVTTYAYDAANRVLMRVEDAGAGKLNLTTLYGYDGMGRVRSTIAPNNVETSTEYYRDSRVKQVTVGPGVLNLITAYAYDKAGNTITVTEGAGSGVARTTQYSYDKLGRRVSEVVDSGAGKLNLTTTYAYDLNDNLVRKTDPRGYKTRYTYDNAGRLRYTVDALGGVTETTYYRDAVNTGLDQDTTLVKRYANAAHTSLSAADQLSEVDVASKLTADATRDRIEQTVLDRDGREIYRIDALGGVVRKFYNAAGLLDRQVAYVNTLPAGTIYATAAEIPAIAATTADRETRYVYDLRGQLRFQLEALGTSGSNPVMVVSETVYGPGGNVRYQGTYNTTYTLTGATPTVSALASWATSNANAASDRFTLYWYDAANRQRFVQDAEGYFVGTTYNLLNRTVTETRYSTGLATLRWQDDLASVTGLVTTAGADRATTTTRDSAGRVTQITDALNQSEYFGYDAVGNRTSYTNQKGSVWTYTYDGAGRMLTEVSPAVSVTTVTDNGASLTTGAPATVALTTRMTYDALGNVLTRTEADGHAQARTTTYAYDLLGRQTKTTFPSVGVFNGTVDGLPNAYEYVDTLYTEVTYDSLGDAVMNRDVAGARSYKVYDRLGRLQYEVDEGRFLTAYTYDTLSNKLTTTRHINALLNTLPATPLLATGVTSRLTTSATGDRTLTMSYDRAGRTTQVQQNGVATFDGPAATLATSSPHTKYLYNAFGEVIKEDRAAKHNGGSTVYATTYRYYDQLGQQTAEVDPLGYLTTYTYNFSGEVVSRKEFSKALSLAGVTTGSYGSPTTTIRTSSANDPVGYDREVAYAYDKLGRKVTETWLNQEYSTVSAGTPSRTSGSVVINYGYDAVGNQTAMTTSAGTTYTYYDALGRSIAVAGVARDLGDGATITTGTVLTPLVEMRRNARGDVVHQIQYAASPSVVTPTTFTPTTSAGDRHIRHLVDNLGRIKRTEDPRGADSYTAYTARGEVAKEWQPVTSVDGAVTYLVTIKSYDALGQELQSRDFQADWVDNSGKTPTTRYDFVSTAQTYNAFGEVTERGVSKTTDYAGPTDYQEKWDYDQAGRIWRTNADDGVYRVYLYNLDGKATAEIRARTDVSVAGDRDIAATTMTSATANDWGTAGTMRTETNYDLNGRVLSQKLPVFTQDTQVDAMLAQPSVSVTYDPWAEPELDYGYEVGFAKVVTTQYEYIEGWGGVSWAETNYVWSPATPKGPVVDGQPTGGGFYPVLDTNGVPTGTWLQAAGYTSAALVSNRTLNWVSPRAADYVIVRWKVQGAGSWAGSTYAKTVQMGSLSSFRLGADISGLAANTTYQYQIEYYQEGQGMAALQAGTFSNLTATGGTVADPTSTTTAALAAMTENYAPQSAQTLDRWGNALTVTSTGGGTTTYRYNQAGQLIEKKLPSGTILATHTGTVVQTTGQGVQENHYDTLGRLIATKDANGSINRASYNAAGQLVWEDRADGGWESFRYDAFGQQVGTTNQHSYRTWSTYDGVGNLTSVAREHAPNGQATAVTENYGYDEVGRRISQTTGETASGGGGETYKFYYDRQGNVVKRKTPMGAETSFAYDVYGNKTSETNALGSSKTWSYSNAINGYFRRVTGHTELSSNGQAGSVAGATYTYSYAGNYAGWLTSTTTNFGGNLGYAYDAAGRLRTITDTGTPTSAGIAAGLDTPTNRLTTYAYDAAGRRTKETTKVDNVVHQNVRTAYDTQDRMAYVWDNLYAIRNQYDAQGNRTYVGSRFTFGPSAQRQWLWSYQSGANTVLRRSDPSALKDRFANVDLYYRHDSMNRVTLAGGNASLAVDQKQGIALTYDTRGNRLSSYTYVKAPDATNGIGKWTFANNSWSLTAGYTTETYDYDGLGRLTSMMKDGQAAVLVNTYDRASRVTSSSNKSIESGNIVTRSETKTYSDDGLMTYQLTKKGTVNESEVFYGSNTAFATFASGSWSEGYDATGTLRKYRTVASASNFTTTYTTSYRAGETYQATTRTASNSGGSNSTVQSYDVNANLIKFTHNQSHKNRFFALDAAGNVLTAVQGNLNAAQAATSLAEAAISSTGYQPGYYHQRFYFANGQHTGTSGQLVGITEGGQYESPRADFDPIYQSVGPGNPGTAPTLLTVERGDTLRVIAQRIYGDGSLWYLLADENGLTNPDTALEPGTTLQMPPAVVNRSNTATTFTPFSIENALGDTTPTQPKPPPPKKGGGCGGLGAIIMVVVAVVATVITAGALTAALPGAFGAAGAAGAAAGSGALLGGASTLGALATAGGVALGAGGFGAIAIGAVAGAVGSIVSQGVGIAIGAQEKFNWKGVALGAISGAIGGAIGGSAPATPGAAATSAAGKTWLTTAKAVGAQSLRAAAGNVLSQGVGIAVGLQDKFDWRSLAVSAVAAPLANRVGAEVGSAFTSPGVSRFASDIASGLTTVGVRMALGGKVDMEFALADVFGNAIGNSIVGALTTSPAYRQLPDEQRDAVNQLGKQYGLDPRDPRNTAMLVRAASYEQGLVASEPFGLSLEEVAGKLKTMWGELVNDSPDSATLMARDRSGREIVNQSWIDKGVVKVYVRDDGVRVFRVDATVSGVYAREFSEQVMSAFNQPELIYGDSETYAVEVALEVAANSGDWRIVELSDSGWRAWVSRTNAKAGTETPHWGYRGITDAGKPVTNINPGMSMDFFDGEFGHLPPTPAHEFWHVLGGGHRLDSKTMGSYSPLAELRAVDAKALWDAYSRALAIRP